LESGRARLNAIYPSGWKRQAAKVANFLTPPEADHSPKRGVNGQQYWLKLLIDAAGVDRRAVRDLPEPR
jgi:hypothetical protein